MKPRAAAAAILAALAAAACTGDDPAPAAVPVGLPQVSAIQQWPGVATDSGGHLLGAAAWNGEHHVLVWQNQDAFPGPPEHGRIKLRRVRSDGTFLDTAPVVLATASFWRSPGVACGAGVCLVAWAEDSAVRARFWTAAAEAGPVFDVAVDGVDGDVVVTAASEGWVVTWAHGGSIVTRRLALDGAPIDPAPLVVLTAPAAGRAVACGVAGCVHAVISVEAENASTLHLVRRGHDGVTSAVVTHALPVATASLALASDGNRWLLAVGHSTTFVDPDTLDLGAMTPLQASTLPWSGAVRVDGGWWLASLAEVLRLDDAGVPATPIAPLRGSVAQQGPRVMLASDGATGLVASWLSTSTTTTGLLASRLPATGGFPLDGSDLHISGAAPTQEHPVVVATSQGFLLAWREDRHLFEGPMLTVLPLDPTGEPRFGASLPIMPLPSFAMALEATASSGVDGERVLISAGELLADVAPLDREAQLYDVPGGLHALHCLGTTCLVALRSGLRLMTWPNDIVGLQERPPILRPASDRPVLADDGRSFAVGWLDGAGGHLVWIDGRGLVGLVRDLGPVPAGAGLGVVADAEGFAAFWNDGTGLWTAGLDDRGALRGAPRPVAVTSSALDDAGNLLAVDLGRGFVGDLLIAGGPDGLAVAAVDETAALIGPVLVPATGLDAQATRLSAATAPSGRTIVVWSAIAAGDAARTPRVHWVVIDP